MSALGFLSLASALAAPPAAEVVDLRVALVDDQGREHVDSLVPGEPITVEITITTAEGEVLSTRDGTLTRTRGQLAFQTQMGEFDERRRQFTPSADLRLANERGYWIRVVYDEDEDRSHEFHLKPDLASVIGPEPEDVVDLHAPNPIRQE